MCPDLLAISSGDEPLTYCYTASERKSGKIVEILEKLLQYILVWSPPSIFEQRDSSLDAQNDKLDAQNDKPTSCQAAIPTQPLQPKPSVLIY